MVEYSSNFLLFKGAENSQAHYSDHIRETEFSLLDLKGSHMAYAFPKLVWRSRAMFSSNMLIFSGKDKE